jgi:hypothetical protein
VVAHSLLSCGEGAHRKSQTDAQASQRFYRV